MLPELIFTDYFDKCGLCKQKLCYLTKDHPKFIQKPNLANLDEKASGTNLNKITKTATVNQMVKGVQIATVTILLGPKYPRL